MFKQNTAKGFWVFGIVKLVNLLPACTINLSTKTLLCMFMSSIAYLSYAQSHYAHPHWVGLFPADFFESYVVGENRNEIGKWELEIYPEPDSSSEQLGLLKIVFTPETGLKAEYYEQESEKKYPIQPHLFDPDYGYGPYFHLTITATNNDYYKLRLNDSDNSYWANFESAFGKNNVAVIQLLPGMILRWENSKGSYDDIIIEHVDPDSLVVRSEQAIDMWCGDDSLRYAPYTTKLLPKSDWKDSEGVSRFYIPYTRGC